MVIGQGDVCWASLGEPRGSEPGFRLPILIVQGDDFNASRISHRDLLLVLAGITLVLGGPQPLADS